MTTYSVARTRAEAWCAAWNARDLDAVCAHYSSDVELCSPLVAARFDQPDGVLRGLDAVRAYFAIGMGNPDLKFELVDVLMGRDAICVLYRRETGRLVADTMHLGPDGLAQRMTACYAVEEAKDV